MNEWNDAHILLLLLLIIPRSHSNWGMMMPVVSAHKPQKKHELEMFIAVTSPIFSSSSAKDFGYILVGHSQLDTLSLQ